MPSMSQVSDRRRNGSDRLRDFKLSIVCTRGSSGSAACSDDRASRPINRAPAIIVTAALRLDVAFRSAAPAARHVAACCP